MSYLLYMVSPASTNKSVRAKLLFLWETVAWLWLTFSTYLTSKRPLWTKTETILKPFQYEVEYSDPIRIYQSHLVQFVLFCLPSCSKTNGAGG